MVFIYNSQVLPENGSVFSGNLNQGANAEVFQDCLEETCGNPHREDICDGPLQPQLSKEVLRVAPLSGCAKDLLQREHTRCTEASDKTTFPILCSELSKARAVFFRNVLQIHMFILVIVRFPIFVQISEISLNARLTKESVNQSLPTISHVVAERAHYNGMDASGRADENGVNEAMICEPAGNRVKDFVSLKAGTVQGT